MELLQREELLRPDEKFYKGKIIYLPVNWWITNNSYFPTLEEKELKILEFPQKNNIEKPKEQKFYIPEDWNIKFGDHRVKEVYKDMSYYIELKKKLLKNSIYIAVILGGYVVYYFSKFLAGI